MDLGILCHWFWYLVCDFWRFQMNIVQEIRNQMAELGRELTIDDVRNSMDRIVILCQVVQGNPERWLNATDDEAVTLIGTLSGDSSIPAILAHEAIKRAVEIDTNKVKKDML
jgi:hypothetical protein